MVVKISIEFQTEENVFHLKCRPERFSEMASRVSEALEASLVKAGVEHTVLLNPGPVGDGWERHTFGGKRAVGWYHRVENQFRKIRYPRLGAFEVTLNCSSDPRLPPFATIWSRLETQRWPDPDRLARQVAELLAKSRQNEDFEDLLRQLSSRQRSSPRRDALSSLAQYAQKHPRRRSSPLGCSGSAAQFRQARIVAPFAEGGTLAYGLRVPRVCTVAEVRAAMRRQAERDVVNDENSDSLHTLEAPTTARSRRRHRALMLDNEACEMASNGDPLIDGDIVDGSQQRGQVTPGAQSMSLGRSVSFQETPKADELRSLVNHDAKVTGSKDSDHQRDSEANHPWPVSDRTRASSGPTRGRTPSHGSSQNSSSEGYSSEASQRSGSQESTRSSSRSSSNSRSSRSSRSDSS